MRVASFTVAFLFAIASAASAQRPGPIPRFAADVRGFYSSLKQDPITAENLGIDAFTLPHRGPGGVIDAHLYVLRSRTFALGVGAELMAQRGSAQVRDATGTATGQTVHQQIRGVAPQISLNFGTYDGWSYVTAGMGPLTFATYLDTAPSEPAPSKMTINLGGGARWFFSNHLAFTVDARFYQTKPETQTEFYPGRQRTRLLVLSAGIGIR
jgi:hypothetical protein